MGDSETQRGGPGIGPGTTSDSPSDRSVNVQITARPTTLAPGDPRHGTAGAYTNHRCRCDDCRAAWATYHRQWRRNRADGVA